MRKKKPHSESEGKSFGGPGKKLDTKRKFDILGILLMVLGLLLFLALVSHSQSDESVSDIGVRGLIKMIAGDKEIQAKADMTANWLGVSGALVANLFITSTIGYFSVAFPILLMVWGWFVLRRQDLKVLAYYTNYSLLLVFLLAALTGIIRLISWMPSLSVYWSGNIGDFLAGLISRLIGTTGGFLAILTVILILAVIVVDYNIHSTLSMMKRILLWFRSLSEAKRQAALAAQENADIVIEKAEEVPEKKSKRDLAPLTKIVPQQPTAPKILQVDAKDVFGMSKKMPVSIDRGEDRFDPLQKPSQPSGFNREGEPLRSNGIISKESVEGLSTMLGRSASDAKPSDEKKATPIKTDQPDPVPEPKLATDSPAISDHEERALQNSLGKRQAPLESDTDIEATNLALSTARIEYQPPTADLLDVSVIIHAVSDAELKMKADLVKEKLAVFGIEITNITVKPGPVVTLFELVPDSSVKISKIVSLADDLALALAARGIRIIAPIPGKSAVGIEIPNNEPELVNFSSVVTSAAFQKTKHYLCLGLGKSITGEVACDDLAKMPHLLIAGATGAGKSVGINVMINSLLFRMHPSDVKFVMIDPKKIELMQYRGLNRHFLAVSPDIDEEIITDPGNAVLVLKSLELEMDMRYTKLAKAGVRHISDYNAKVKSGVLKGSELVKHYRLPYIVVVIDELADLMMTASREVEEPIARIAQLARAVGIHLIVATQRPSVDVITGVIKANFSARIAYQVASRIDARTILDSPGADQLLGNGDMLYLASGHPKPVRIQNAFLTTAEVERVVEHISNQTGFIRSYILPSVRAVKKGQSREDSIGTDDLIYEAARLIVRHQQGSVSLLQRRLKIGYSRAARIVDQLEQVGVVGPYDGSKAREVLIEDESQLEDVLQGM